MKISFEREPMDTFCYWIAERERMRIKREDDEQPKPWTDDPILRDHRFCNVRRMDDTVSRWLVDRWYDNTQSPRVLLVAAALARHFNWPPTLSVITDGAHFHAEHWDRAEISRKLHLHADKGNKIFTGAYIVNGASRENKIDAVLENIAAIQRHSGTLIVPTNMKLTWLNLRAFHGIGPFMAGQMVADLRFTRAMMDPPLDVMSWAPIGPGSVRGMRRLMGEDANGSMPEDDFEEALASLVQRLQRMKRLEFVIEKLEAMDVENCLCEYDKYMRVKNGEGQTRSKYPGMP